MPMPVRKPFLTTLMCAAAVCLASAPARAHDTWFETAGRGAGGERLLALGTGNQFPLQESGIDIKYLVQQGCRAPESAAPPVSMVRVRDAAAALMLRVPVVPASPAPAPLSCWAQLSPFEIEIEPRIVGVYLDEVRAPQSVRDDWAAMLARGVPWRERYTKHARIELGVLSAASRASGMAMDVLLDAGGQPARTRQALGFQVLRDGRPLPGLAVELRTERARLGLWFRTDADGRVSFAPPLPGNWLLRGTELRRSTDDPDRWVSGFVTLAFEVAP